MHPPNKNPGSALGDHYNNSSWLTLVHALTNLTNRETATLPAWWSLMVQWFALLTRIQGDVGSIPLGAYIPIFLIHVYSKGHNYMQEKNDRNGLVYKVTCRHEGFGEFYLRETKRRLNERVKDHNATYRGFIKVWSRRAFRICTRAKFIESIVAEMLEAARQRRHHSRSI